MKQDSAAVNEAIRQQGEERRLEKEAERMDMEARKLERPRSYTPPIHKNAETDHDETDLESNFGTLQLSPEPHSQQPRSNSPYSTYHFSRSIIMDQASPESRASLSTDQSYADSNTTLTEVDTNTTTETHPSDEPTTSNTHRKRYKKFCMLPPKDAQGNKDPTWIRVFMKNMDEVTAHTGLFFLNETYERLVGDVVARIEDWVKEAESVRVVRELEGTA